MTICAALSTVPDWIQAISSVFAVVGLVWTLNLQRKTSEDQRTMLLQAQEEERISLMPIFKIADTSIINGPPTATITYLIRVEDTAAYNVSFLVIPNTAFSLQPPLFPGDFQKERAEAYTITRIGFEEGFTHILTISYSDKKQRYYQQRLLTDGFSVQMELPTKTERPIEQI